MWLLFEFSMAAVTNYHKLSSLKQHKLSYISGGKESKIDLTSLNQKVGRAAFLLE